MFEVATDGEKKLQDRHMREKVANARRKPYLMTAPVRQLLNRIGFPVAPLE